MCTDLVQPWFQWEEVDHALRCCFLQCASGCVLSKWAGLDPASLSSFFDKGTKIPNFNLGSNHLSCVFFQRAVKTRCGANHYEEACLAALACWSGAAGQSQKSKPDELVPKWMQQG